MKGLKSREIVVFRFSMKSVFVFNEIGLWFHRLVSFFHILVLLGLGPFGTLANMTSSTTVSESDSRDFLVQKSREFLPPGFRRWRVSRGVGSRL